MAVAQESEFLAVNQKIRVRIPAVTPLRKARTRQSRRTIGLQNRITRCESGVRVHFGAIVQEQDNAMALRRSGCDSPWLHHLEGHHVSGHEEDSNPRRSDRRDTRGSTEMPDHFS